VALIGSMAGAQAADLESAAPPPSVSATAAQDGWNPWIVSLGGTVTYGPRYPGASRYGFSGIPAVGFRRVGTPEEFSAPEDNLDYALIDTPMFKFGPVVALRGGRSTDDDWRLRGLDNYPWTIEAGAFAEFWPVPGVFRTRLEVRHGVRAHDGFVANLSADVVQHLGRFTVSGGPRLALADGNLSQVEFGITPVAAARNGLVAPYRAQGGVQSVGVGAAVSYRWSKHWTTLAYVDYDRLVGSAAHSPITRRFGSADQFTVGLGLTYSFRTLLPF
jgi:outer membrane scaffolding protein for murein synthesis (MipA/OmpV family)